MALLLFYVFLALFVSFLCSIMESVLLSTPVSFLNVKLENGKKGAGIMLKMKENIDKSLAAILSLNTIAHTVGAAGIGVQTAKLFEDLSFGIISAILTLLILVFSEIIPKTIGAMYWRQIALLSGKIIRVMVVITWPFVVLAGFITRIFSRKNDEVSISREEVSAMAKIGEEEGVFSEKESKIISNLIKLRGIKVTNIMTPRVVVTIADENMQIGEFLKQKELLYFSRIPVFNESRDNITGFVLRQDAFDTYNEKSKVTQLKDVKRDIVVMPDMKTVIEVWDELIESKEHIALIVDEYGGMDGIVTMEDIIESLLGLEIVDERDKIIDMQIFARERWDARQLKYNLLKNTDAEDEESK